MTVDNCIKLLEAYAKQMENPVDIDGRVLTGDWKRNVEAQSKKNYEMMKEHILKSRKFKDHPIQKKLQDKPEVKKEDGKKSKG